MIFAAGFFAAGFFAAGFFAAGFFAAGFFAAGFFAAGFFAAGFFFFGGIGEGPSRCSVTIQLSLCQLWLKESLRLTESMSFCILLSLTNFRFSAEYFTPRPSADGTQRLYAHTNRLPYSRHS